jgi:hypothetical protein
VALLAALSRFFLLFERFGVVVMLAMCSVNFRDVTCFHGAHLKGI